MRPASASVLLAAALVAGAAQAADQPVIAARSKPVLSIGGLQFKDLNGDGGLQPYEDWRLAADARARDLVGRMTLAERAGAMLIATNNPECDGSLSKGGADLIDTQKMTRFILRSKVTEAGADCSVKLTGFALRGGYAQSPARMARFTNAVQQRLEAGRLGIPGLFKDNARNHVETNAMFGISAGAGSFTEFPKEAGLAAAALGAASPVTPDGTTWRATASGSPTATPRHARGSPRTPMSCSSRSWSATTAPPVMLPTTPPQAEGLLQRRSI